MAATYSQVPALFNLLRNQTTGNLIKTCMGVGILALPYTAILVTLSCIIELQAGFVPSFLLIVIIALWVYYCMHLLIQTNEACTSVLIPTNEDPYKNVSRKVNLGVSFERQGLGSFGVFLLNFSFIVTLIGVGAAYQITFNNMLANLPWIIWKFPLGKFTWFWTLIFGVLILPLVLLRSMGYFP